MEVSSKIKVVFAGSPHVSAKILENLILNKDFDLKLVISQPPKRKKRGALIEDTEVTKVAKKNNVSVINPERVDHEVKKILDEVMYPTMQGLIDEGTPYLGFLYAGLMIKDDDIKNAITKIESIGRLQEIKSGKIKDLIKNNRLLLDGSHNEDGARVLNEYLQTLDCNKHFIIGMMSNKNHEEYISHFKDISSLTTVDIPNQQNAISGKKLKEKFPLYDRRFRVRPGITGWSQIKHPSDLEEDDVRQKLRYDFYYIENWQFVLININIKKPLKV